MKTTLLVVAAALTGAVVAATVKLAWKKSAADPANCGDHCAIQAPAAGESRPAPATATVLEKPEPVHAGEASHREATAGGASPSSASRSKPARFEELFAMPERTKAEIEAKEGAMSRTLSESSLPLLQQRLDSGLGQTVVEDPSDPSGPKHDDEIYAETMKSTGEGMLRAVLPRSEYPDLYRLHDERNRLRKDLARKASEEQLEQAKQGAAGAPH